MLSKNSKFERMLKEHEKPLTVFLELEGIKTKSEMDQKYPRESLKSQKNIMKYIYHDIEDSSTQF